MLPIFKAVIAMSMFALIVHFSEVSTRERAEKEVVKKFKGSGVEPEVDYIDFGERKLRYVAVNEAPDRAPALVFVHGAPGSWDAFKSYLMDTSLTQHAVLASVDRLGYGGSRNDGAEPSIIDQAASIAPLVERYHSEGRAVYLIGHSYGGPIIGRLAMTHPTQVSGLMMLAPAMDPEHEKQFWFTKLGIKAPTKWITPRAMRIAAYEKLGHVAALKEIEDDWGDVRCEVVFIHGKKDVLVPFENYAYAEKVMTNASLEMIALEDENHFLPWTKEQLITEKLANWINK